MRSKPTSRPPERGFSLVELLVATAAASVLLLAVTSFYLAEQRSLARARLVVRGEQQVRIALDQIVRELRVAGRDPTDAGGIGLVYAAANEVRFTLDADGNGTAVGPTEIRGFRRSGTTLETWAAGAVAPWVPFAESVAATGTAFRYYREDGTEVTALPTATLAVLETIRRIDVTLGYVGTGPGGSFSRTQTATVQLRNVTG